jgi:hypothetical protein
LLKEAEHQVIVFVIYKTLAAINMEQFLSYIYHEIPYIFSAYFESFVSQYKGFISCIDIYLGQLAMGLVSLNGAFVTNSRDGGVSVDIRFLDQTLLGNQVVGPILTSGHFSALTLRFTAVQFRIGDWATVFSVPDDASIIIGRDACVTFFVTNPPTGLALSLVTEFTGTQNKMIIAMRRQLEEPRPVSFRILAMTNDIYLEKLLSLSNFHSLMGNSSNDLIYDINLRGLRDSVPSTKLSLDDFKLIDNSITNIRLLGSATEDSDQAVFDETAMLSSAISVRQAAISKNAHPDDWDITSAENQLLVTNSVANSLFNAFRDQRFAPFFTSAVSAPRASVIRTKQLQSSSTRFLIFSNP